MIGLGNKFQLINENAKEDINKHFKKIIKNGAVNMIIIFNKTILVLGHSRLVEYILLNYASNNVRFSVIVTENRPSNQG